MAPVTYGRSPVLTALRSMSVSAMEEEMAHALPLLSDPMLLSFEAEKTTAARKKCSTALVSAVLREHLLHPSLTAERMRPLVRKVIDFIHLKEEVASFDILGKVLAWNLSSSIPLLEAWKHDPLPASPSLPPHCRNGKW